MGYKFTIFEDILSRIFMMFTSQVSVLITLPFIAASLDIDIFGKICACFIISQLGWTLSEWGTFNYAIERWSYLKSDQIKNKFFCSIFFVNLFLSLIYCSFVYFFISLGIINIPIEYMLITTPTIIFGAIYPLWIFQITKKISKLLIPTIIARFLYVIVIIVFVKDNSDDLLILTSQALCISSITLISFIRLFNFFSIEKFYFDLQNIYSLFKKSTTFFIASISLVHINSCWAFVLSLTSNFSLIALYSFADQIFRGMASLNVIIAQSLRINLFNQSNKNTLKNILFFVFLYFIFGLISFLFFEFISFSFKNSFYFDSFAIIKIMFIGSLMQGVILFFNYPLIGKIFGTIFLNRLGFIFLFIHFIFMLFWLSYSQNLKLMCLLILLVFILQILLYFNLLVKKQTLLRY